MRTLIFSLLCLWAMTQIHARGEMPIIKATSSKVDVRVGDDYFSKGGWTLEPGKKPDIFSIGSQWNYAAKKVTFKTDLDSVSFNVQPGHEYDFEILLNGTTPCFIRIKTLAHPVFFSNNVAMILLTGWALVLGLLLLNRNRMKARSLLKFGYVAPVLFWIMTFLSGHIHLNYNHFKNTISELGAIGTRSELFTSCSLLLLSLLCIFFSTGFYKASKALKISLLPAVLSFAMPVTMIWASIFTLGNAFHGAAGPVTLLIPLGCLFTYFFGKKKERLSKFRALSLISFFVTLLLLVRLIKPLGNDFEGLIQRFFYLGWTLWTITTSYFLLKEVKAAESLRTAD